jgi:hypothetical protein
MEAEWRDPVRPMSGNQKIALLLLKLDTEKQKER